LCISVRGCYMVWLLILDTTGYWRTRKALDHDLSRILQTDFREHLFYIPR